MSEKKYEQAISCFADALRTYGGNLDARYFKGLAELQAGEPQNAVQDLGTLLEAKSGYGVECYLALSAAHRQLARLDSALSVVWKWR